MKHVSVGHFFTIGANGPDQVINGIDPLQVHGDALNAVGDLTRHRVTLQATHLLKVGKLGHFQDRKSTRLNSSHVAISYAVFCLKKKITKNIDKLSRINSLDSTLFSYD